MSATTSSESNNNKVTAETYGAVDNENTSEELWMIRIPPKLAKVWENAPEGTVLGDLVFTKGGKPNNNGNVPPLKPSLEVHASEDLLTGPDQSDVPLEYSMEAMTKRVPVLYPFTRNSNGSVSVHGTVTRTANLQASRSDSRYRQMCKNRLLQTNVTSNRFVKPVQANELSVRKTVLPDAKKGFGSAVQAFGQRQMQGDAGGDGDDSRKRKYEGQPTQRVIFELFSQQPRWTVKELRSASGRIEKEIKLVLSEIGEYHRSGEHRGTWELKKEFRKQD